MSLAKISEKERKIAIAFMNPKGQLLLFNISENDRSYLQSKLLFRCFIAMNIQFNNYYKWKLFILFLY